jgi:hypothetical protein
MVAQTQEAGAVNGDPSMDHESNGPSKQHPLNTVDHRPQKGPLLTLLWSEEEPLSGQSLYLGGEV